MTPFHENIRGIIAISVCNLLMLTNDTLLKLVSSEMPLGEIFFSRSIVASLVVLPLIWLGGSFRHIGLLRHRAVGWRMIAEITSAYLFLAALFRIPIANANAILQVVPLMVTAAAAIFLGEKVGWRRCTAIGAGFFGVLVVVRPGLAGFDAYSLIALAAMFFVTLRDMTTRFMPRHLPAPLVALATAITVGLSGPVFGVAAGESWVVPGGRSSGLIVASVFFLVGGYLTAVEFMRHGDVSVVAPFRYTQVIWAIIAGYVVWRDVPDAPMLVGTAIIIGSGVYTFQREHRLSAGKAYPSSSAPPRHGRT
jgi:drug/metabolite transporter (DMT)-like permease